MLRLNWSTLLSILTDKLWSKSRLSSNFQYDYRSSRSTADLETAKFGRTARAFNRTAVTLYPRLLTGFGIDFFTNSTVMEFQVGYLALFRLFSVIIGFKWFWIESHPKNIQLKLVLLKDRFLDLLSSYYTLMTSLMLPGILSYVTWNIVIHAVDTPLYSKCDWASDLWQHLELASELESNLQVTLDCSRK